MKKLLRKNQIIITALVVMVALAGYLSLTNEDELAVGVLNRGSAVSEQAAVGTEEGTDPEEQASEGASEEKLAAENGSQEEVKDDTVADISDEDIAAAESKSASKENAGEAVLVNNTVTADYFEAAKLSREQTRAKNNEKETATENLLAAKGFQEVVVTIVDDSVDVIVNAETLTEQQIAQIEDVVKRKTECSSDKIVISPVGKKD